MNLEILLAQSIPLAPCESLGGGLETENGVNGEQHVVHVETRACHELAGLRIVKHQSYAIKRVLLKTALRHLFPEDFGKQVRSICQSVDIANDIEKLRLPETPGLCDQRIFNWSHVQPTFPLAAVCFLMFL